MRMKKIAAITAAALLSFSVLPAAAYAADTQSDLEESDGKLIINEAGTYVLTGSMQGSVYVDPGAGDVTLVLDGVDISGADTASILAVSGDSLTISVPEGAVNRITGTDVDTQYPAAIWSAVDTTLEGNGEVYVGGSNDMGFRVENADLTVNGGKYSVTADTYGLSVSGGTLTINDGYFQMRCGVDTIDPDTDAIINGGTIIDLNAVSQGSSAGSAESSASSYGTAEASAQTPGTADISTQTAGAADSTSQTADASAASQETDADTAENEQIPQMPDGGQFGQFQNLESAEEPSEIVYGTSSNSAMDLTEDMENATYITMTEDNSQVKISSSGTYVVSGESSDGNITVKKGTTGVVLVLDNLNLTSTTGATVSVNKEAEVKIVISGDVVLTDAENPEDENSEDAEVADAFDGAALKAKADSQVFVTGDGTLTINGTAKNGIKAGDDSSLIFDEVTVNINAVNDGINANYDVTLLGGNFTISAGDDAIHADHILTVGDTDGSGPVIRVTDSVEGMEGTVVNVLGGDISIVSSDDAINAANKDALYEGELDYSFNMLGGKVVINSQGDGLDSNGDINLIDGSMEIRSGTANAEAGEAGIDYDGQLYIDDDFNLNNNRGVSGPDGMPQGMNGGQFGGQPQGMNNGQFGGQPQGMNNGQFGGQSQSMGGGQFGGQTGF